jgi:hypothetical protein
VSGYCRGNSIGLLFKTVIGGSNAHFGLYGSGLIIGHFLQRLLIF